METIVSFTIDHLKLKSGLYVSRKDKDGATVATTFDLRLITPYEDDFLDVKGMHTVEHLGATYLRNSDYKDRVVYFGPMGCQTGFYLVMFGDLSSDDIYDLIVDMCTFIENFEGEIPGATQIQCGNYLSHDLNKAKEMIKKYKSELTTYKRLVY